MIIYEFTKFIISKNLKQFRLWKDLKKKYKDKNVIIEFPFFITDISNFYIEPYTYIGPGACFTTYGKINIREGTILGPRIKIHTGNHNYNGDLLPYDKDFIIGDVNIERNVWIGSDVLILPGVTIGEGSIIGAGAVVSKSIPPLSIAVGNPCKIINQRDKLKYEILKAENKIYLKNKGRIKDD